MCFLSHTIKNTNYTQWEGPGNQDYTNFTEKAEVHGAKSARQIDGTSSSGDGTSSSGDGTSTTQINKVMH